MAQHFLRIHSLQNDDAKQDIQFLAVSSLNKLIYMYIFYTYDDIVHCCYVKRDYLREKRMRQQRVNEKCVISVPLLAQTRI